MTAFNTLGQSFIVGTNTIWPVKPKIFTIWTFKEQVIHTCTHALTEKQTLQKQRDLAPSMLPSYRKGGRDDENLGQGALWEGGMGPWEEQEAEFAVVKVVHRSSLL